MTFPASLPAVPDDVSDPSAALVAGTLCLMSCFAQHPLAIYAERVAANLARLAAEPLLTPEMRTVCRRLGERWDTIGQEARAQASQGPLPDDPRPLH